MSITYNRVYAGKFNQPSRRNKSKHNRYLKLRENKNKRRLQARTGSARPIILSAKLRWVVGLILIIISVTSVMPKTNDYSSILKNKISHMSEKITEMWAAITEYREKIITSNQAQLEKTKASISKENIVVEGSLAWLIDEKIFLLDKQGKVHALASSEQNNYNLPVISGIKVREEPSNMGVVLKSEVPLNLLKKILARNFNHEISEINFNDHNEIIMYTRDGIKIFLRRHSALQRDLIRLEAVLEDIRVKAKSVAMLDMRYDKYMVMRPHPRR